MPSLVSSKPRPSVSNKKYVYHFFGFIILRYPSKVPSGVTNARFDFLKTEPVRSSIRWSSIWGSMMTKVDEIRKQGTGTGEKRRFAAAWAIYREKTE